jgi:glycosyltransferase XagB
VKHSPRDTRELSGVPLPAALALLLTSPANTHPLDTSLLFEAARRAEALGVSPVTCLFSLGAITPVDYACALNDHWCASAVSFPLVLHQDTDVVSLQRGIAPLADGRWLISCEAPILPRLLAMPEAAVFGQLVAITAPAFDHVLRIHLSAEITRQISCGIGVDLIAHRLSAKGAHKPGSVRVPRPITGFALMLVLVALTWDAETTSSVILLVFSLLFLVSMSINLVTVLEDIPVEGAPYRRLPERMLPTYGIIVPLYREAAIVERLLRALQALDYPREKLDVCFVVEQDDLETRRALDAQMREPCMRVLVVPPGAPRTKPRALNAALLSMRATHVVVYDAEDEPEPQQLQQAAAAFAVTSPNVACLQARLSIDNTADGLLATLFTLEYAALFDVIKPGLARLALPVPLGGTSNHFRMSALRQMGGWDAWNVTEDADLGLRMARFGFLVEDLPSTTFEEAPVTLPAWMRQRQRWLKGWMQTLLVHTRDPIATFRQMGPGNYGAALAIMGGIVLGSLAFPLLSGLMTIRILTSDDFGAHGPVSWFADALALMVYLTGFIAMVVPAMVALRRRALRHLLPFVALMPLYGVLVSMAAWMALWELLRQPYRWNKTEHGVRRSTRLKGRTFRTTMQRAG